MLEARETDASRRGVFCFAFDLGRGFFMHIYANLVVLGLGGMALISFSAFQVFTPAITFLLSFFVFLVFLLVAFLNTRAWIEKEHHRKIRTLKEQYERKIRRIKNEYDTATLEKAIREGTKTLIKNAVDYLKIENIKNEMPPSAAIQNLQLDKYGQIIELLADFSLILPDYDENRRIVEREINHQIEIYEIDEKLFAEFLKTILGKYHLTVTKKMRERLQLVAGSQSRLCPACKERIPVHSVVCRYCGHSMAPKPPVPKRGGEKGSSGFREEAPGGPAAASGPKFTDGGPREASVAVRLRSAVKSGGAKPAADGAKPANELEYVRRGKALYESGAYHDAIRLLTRAIALNPRAVQAYYARGVIFTRLDQPERAQQDFQTAEKMGHPKAAQALNALKFSETQEWRAESGPDAGSGIDSGGEADGNARSGTESPSPSGNREEADSGAPADGAVESEAVVSGDSDAPVRAEVRATVS
jgi:tetratricopeptide (TPR) repeat protein